MRGPTVLNEISANEVIIAVKARLKHKRDEYFRETREAAVRAQVCVDWLDVLDHEIRQQEKFHPVVEGSAPPQGEKP